MTGRPLIAVGIVATLGLVAAALAAYAGVGFPRHLLLGVGAVALLLVAHLTLLVYLVRSRKVVIELVASAGLEPELASAADRQVRLLFPWLAGFALITVATIVAGGAAFTNSLPLAVHHALAWMAVAAQGAVVWIESRLMAEHRGLVAAINTRLTA